MHILLDESNPISIILSFYEEYVNDSLLKNGLDITTEPITSELTMAQPQWFPGDEISKINIPRKWRYSERFPNNLILRKSNNQI